MLPSSFKVKLNKFLNPLMEIEEKYKKIKENDLNNFHRLCEFYKIDHNSSAVRYQLANLMVSKPLTSQEIDIIIKGTAARLSRR